MVEYLSNLELSGDQIASLVAHAGGDVSISLQGGGFILISPNDDLMDKFLIEKFPEGIKSVEGL